MKLEWALCLERMIEDIFFLAEVMAVPMCYI